MSLSRATLVQRIRRLLDDNPFETYETNGVLAGDTTLDVPDGTKFAEGMIVEFQDDGEQCLVRSVSGNTLTVKRGHNGTTPAAHSANTVIAMDPVFTYAQIVDAIERCIRGLWPYAWKRVTVTINPNPASTVWYNLASDCIDLIKVTQLYGQNSQHVAIYGKPGSGLPVQLEHGLPTSLVASGVGIRFPSGFAHSSNQIKVDYRAKITTNLTGGSYDDVDDGLMAEAIVYGACAKLVAAKVAPRVTQEDTSMGDATVQPSDRLGGAAWFEAKRREYLNQLYDELMRTIPPMSKWGH